MHARRTHRLLRPRAQLRDGSGTPVDQAKAATYFEKACDLGYGSACFVMAKTLRAGSGVVEDDRKANALLRRTCELGDGEGMHGAGINYAEGRGVPGNQALAIEQFEQGCNLGDGWGCTDSGSSDQKALASSPIGREQTSCTRKDACSGPLSAARTWPASTRAGWGCRRDSTQANVLLEKSCRLKGADACHRLALKYETGSLGAPHDQEKANSLFAQACNLGHGGACTNIGFYTETGERREAGPCRGKRALPQGLRSRRRGGLSRPRAPVRARGGSFPR